MEGLHNYPEYGAFICGSQVQLDVSRENYLTVINVFNQIEAAKAYLLPIQIFRFFLEYKNSSGFSGSNQCMAFYRKCGCNSKDFQTEDEFFAYLDRSALFTANEMVNPTISIR